MCNVLFSIIIPVYNVEQYLSDCLDSVLGQPYEYFEVICVNDGSTDNSKAILDEYAINHKNLIVINSDNGGTASARNIGLEKASGQYVWFIDSDDWIERNALCVLSELIKDRNVDILSFNGKLKYEESGVEEYDDGFSEDGLTGWEYYNKYALQPRKFHFVCVVLRLYRRKFLIENNLFFEKGILHEDNLWIPIAFYYAKTVKVCPHSLYIYRIRKGSKMQTISANSITDGIKVANRLACFFIPITNIEKQTVYREIAGEYFNVFMPEIHNLKLVSDRKLKEQINWKDYKKVSIYPRHKRIYHILFLSSSLFRIYIKTEKLIKSL